MNNTIYMTFLMCVFVIGMLAGSLVVILLIKTKKNEYIDKTERTRLNKSEEKRNNMSMAYDLSGTPELNMNANTTGENVSNANLLAGRISETKSLNQILSEAANENFAQTLRNQLSEVDKDFEYLHK